MKFNVFKTKKFPASFPPHLQQQQQQNTLLVYYMQFVSAGNLKCKCPRGHIGCYLTHPEKLI